MEAVLCSKGWPVGEGRDWGDRMVGQSCSKGFFRGEPEAASVKQSPGLISFLPGPPQRSRASMGGVV